MNQDMASRKRHYIRRLASLENERASWESHWQKLADNFLPRRCRFLSKGAQTNKGEELNKNLFDSTGTQAIRTLSSGMQSGLTSPAAPWFRIGLQDDLAAQAELFKNWLHATQLRLTNVFGRSNFYDQVHLLYSELSTYGTGCLLIEEDSANIIRCRTLSIGEYCIDTNAEGRVDTLYRRLRMTARQIEQSWPNTCPERIKDMAKQDNATWLEVLHIIEPNPNHNPKRQAGPARPFISVYALLDAEQTILEDSGYYEFPALCPRWDATGSDIYGRSPAMDALPDVAMLQRMRKDGLEALAREVRPPLNVSNGANGQTLDISPGAINHTSPLAQGQAAVTPLYQVRANLSDLNVWIADYQRQIKETLFNDLFAMLSNLNKQMTATEVAERNAEKMLLLGPVLDRLRSELFQPLIERVFGIMMRQGQIPLPPEELQGQEVKVEFISILAQAQKSKGIAGVERVVGFTMNLAQAWPQALDKLNVDEAIEQVAEMVGTPPALVNSDEAVEEIRGQRAEQQAQAQQMEMMQQGVGMAQGAAKAAKDSGMMEGAMNEQA